MLPSHLKIKHIGTWTLISINSFSDWKQKNVGLMTEGIADLLLQISETLDSLVTPETGTRKEASQSASLTPQRGGAPHLEDPVLRLDTTRMENLRLLPPLLFWIKESIQNKDIVNLRSIETQKGEDPPSTRMSVAHIKLDAEMQTLADLRVEQILLPITESWLQEECCQKQMTLLIPGLLPRTHLEKLCFLQVFQIEEKRLAFQKI